MSTHADSTSSAAAAGTTPAAAAEQTTLGRGLKTRHLTMMGLGSAVGAGLFLGTGVGIKAAGSGVLISYIVAGVMVVLVMRMLGEMAAARPASGSFSTYAHMALGHWAGFTTGWLYWFMLIMVLGAEMTGAAAMMGAWFGVSPWIPALVTTLLFTVLNLRAVRGFGEFEYWFAIIKVAVIAAFLVIGALLICGLLPGTTFVGTANFLGHGFAPNGITGIAAGLLAVAFAFGGIEIVTIAAAESEDPATSVSRAVTTIMWRIGLFYLGSVFIITSLLPYDTLDQASGAADSPFTRVLELANIPYAAGFMEVIIVLALLSAFNAQFYATSRLVYSFAQRGDAPRIFQHLSRDKVPTYGVVLSLFFAYVSVAVQWWNPPGLLEFLFNAVGGTLLVVWAMIAISQLTLRRQLAADGPLTLRMWAHPWLGILCLVLLAGLTILMLFDDTSRQQVIVVAVVTVGLVGLSFLSPGRHSTPAD